jgi:hypothetical protein
MRAERTQLASEARKTSMSTRTLGRTVLLGLTLALGATGCTYKTVDRPVTVTTKILPELAKPNLGKEVSGRSCNRVVLLIIPVGFATAESAYEDALAQSPGADALIGFEGRTTTLFIFPFYTQVCAVVHGFAVSSKTLTAEDRTQHRVVDRDGLKALAATSETPSLVAADPSPAVGAPLAPRP